MNINVTIFDFLNLIFGVICIIFHTRLGNFAAEFQNKYMGIKFSEETIRITQLGFFFAGIILTGLEIVHILNIR